MIQLRYLCYDTYITAIRKADLNSEKLKKNTFNIEYQYKTIYHLCETNQLSLAKAC